MNVDEEIDIDGWDFEKSFTRPEVIERSTWPTVKKVLENYGMKDKDTRKEGYTSLIKAASEEKEKLLEQYAIGWMHDIGILFKKDKRKAVDWWTKAAEQGHMDSQYNLGVAYAYGEGIERDMEKAIHW